MVQKSGTRLSTCYLWRKLYETWGISTSDPWREPLRNEASRSGKVFVFGFAGGGGSSLKKLDEAILKG